MKLKLNWILFLLTAAAYTAYPVWRLPVHWTGQWALLNLFVLISVTALYLPLGEVSPRAFLSELKQLRGVILAAAVVCLPFWLTPLPTGMDDQSHSGPAAWLLGRITSAAGFNIKFLPLVTLPTAALLFLALRAAVKRGIRLPGRPAAAVLLLAAANLYFLADHAFGLAGAIGRFETVLRYPPLSKFLYLASYMLFGVHEAPPRAIQFCYMAAASVYMIRLLRRLGTEPRPRLIYLLTAFFPTFFNLSITSELEAGTVFFFSAALYHFLTAAESGEHDQFIKSAFWCSVGLLHKRLLLGMVISSYGALALLWLIDRDRRRDLIFGMKAMLLPVMVGLPFILVGKFSGVRSAGLIPAYFSDPEKMLLTLKGIYWTCGLPLTALLAAAAGYCLIRLRSRPLWLLLYFSAAYYPMISATEAVGYIRHAQPFYIAPVLMLMLAASDIYPRLRSGPARGFAAALLGLLIFQSALARDPYHRKTAFNYYRNVFPYREAAAHLAALPRTGLSVYAPMEVEPSHFYLAKSGLAGKINWDRTLPPDFSALKAKEISGRGAYDYLLLPYTDSPAVPAGMKDIADDLLSSEKFSIAGLFSYHGNNLILLKPAF